MQIQPQLIAYAENPSLETDLLMTFWERGLAQGVR
jgi:hypothetical protein